MIGRPRLACRLELGVARLDRRGDDDELRAHEVDRVVADEHTDALGAQTAHIGAVLLVAALHGVALGVQNVGDRAHADAADAEDMHGPHLAGHLHQLYFPRFFFGRRQRTRPNHYAFFARLPTSSSTRSASRTTASGRPWRFAEAAACANMSGAPSRRPSALARRSGVSSFCSMHQAAARFGKLRRVAQLIVVDGMRQRHEDRRPAHHRQLGDGRSPRAADDEVRLGHLLGKVGEERGQMRAHAG